MKKLLLILVVLGTISCSAYKPSYTVGMSEIDFIQKNKVAKKVVADARGITIYRTRNGMQSMYAFFAFDKGKLFRYEDGANDYDYKFMGL